ncbi:GNAT family N-acetyltransferase [Novilysobacter spongiicola]|uniref:GNAT family N-acetyltransferase n=1 Tax=Novilysobacter spongiicola TaxID=435289 RepID=UPI003CCDDFF3
MHGYLAKRGIAWDSTRFHVSWKDFENRMIVAGADVVGLMRLLPEQDALGLRDLQVLPQHQVMGIGTWAVHQAQLAATHRAFKRLQLRVYEENPARAFYARMGFREVSVVGGRVHMVWAVPLGALKTRLCSRCVLVR